MTVVVEPEARVCLTTPSATKLYATPGTPARQQLDITLHAGAVLEYLPEQIIPFAQAAFRQQMTVRLGPGACVLAMEIVAPGRLARGKLSPIATMTPVCVLKMRQAKWCCANVHGCGQVATPRWARLIRGL